jgi:hypothetical protein
MRFIEDGPDIPEELIEQALAGRAVFLCGAGVSRRVGLPLFKDLTEKIYQRLGETRDNDLAEQHAFGRDEYDRVLRALEKRLLKSGDRSRVRAACAAELAAPKVDLADHKALLVLSQDKSGRPRLLTTNFDTLFEHASRGASPLVPSHAVKALPKPASVSDHGVLHLHGRIADEELDLPETDLVLTSADFGDAYLRDGWASQYIEDRTRTGVLVLVGYQAEDTAMRLLLETLDVDRERFPDLCKIYAIDKGTPASEPMWAAKGIIAVEATDYDVLYSSIREWAKYAANPNDYAKVRIAEILAKAPRDTSDFEREQLRFLIAHGDVASTLAVNNPSLAWLPVLADLKLVGHDQPWLVSWLERNLENPDAVKDAVANIALLGTKVADFLAFRLQHRQTPLAPMFATAWNLIVRHLKSSGRDGIGNGWFDVEPRLSRGERTPEVLAQLTDLLRPSVRVSKRFSIEDTRGAPVTDLRDMMAVDFETDENIDAGEIARLWPATVPVELDLRLLTRLADALDQTLEDAVELGLEVPGAHSATDSDVPSVADHPQNQYRHGFLPIVRVIAEVWSHLAVKDLVEARKFVTRWSESPHKLNRRLALFAAADPAIPAVAAGDVLLRVPAQEYFFSNSTVEVARLIKARWPEFSEETRIAVEQRLVAGPPPGVFREGVDVARVLDRVRYDAIGNIRRDGYSLTPTTLAAYADIAQRYPEWQLRPAEQAGFHHWSGEVTSAGPADLHDLEAASDAELVATALRMDAHTHFGEGNNWTTLCNTDPDRAQRGLAAEARAGRWNAATWRPLLWSKALPRDSAFYEELATMLLQWPSASFGDIVAAAAGLLGTPQGLALRDNFWMLWDKVLANLPDEEDDHDPARYFDRAINTPVGNLAEAIVKKMPSSEGDVAFREKIEPRLNAVCELPGHNGVLARVRLAADLAILHDRAPTWTTGHLLPLFDWRQSLALPVWSARRYANTIGPPALFALTKVWFLEMFGRADVPAKLKEDFADWLLVPLFSNPAYNAGYSLTPVEARTALRRIGSNALWQVGHRFAIEMEAAAPAEKLKTWREVVGPVFRGTWPLDAELQTPRANFKLVQMLRATGDAFPEAVDDVIPLITQEPAARGTTVFSLRDADPALYKLAPRKLLDLLDAIVGAAEPASVYGLKIVLDRLFEADPSVAASPKYQRLVLAAGRDA